MKVGGGKTACEALRAEGVKFVFGIPGTHNIEFYDAMIDEKDMTPVLVTDEQSAGFLADGVARSGGGLACVNVVPGAGLTHAMSGIAECFLDQIPLVVITSGIRRDTGASYQLHDVDQLGLIRPISKAVFLPQNHTDLYRMIRQACRIAKTAPAGPAVVEVPANLFMIPGEVDFEAAAAEFPKFIPDVEADKATESGARAAADILNSAKNIGIYVGLGANNAAPNLIKLAEKLDAVVFTTISGKGVFPEDSPRFVWPTMGRALPGPLQKLEKDLDCLLVLGARFGEVATASYGFSPPENLIHVDADSGVFDKNYKARLKIHAESGAFVSALLKGSVLKDRKSNEEKTRSIKDGFIAVRAQQRDGFPTDGDSPVPPWQLFEAIQAVMGPDTIYVTDSGNGTFLAMEHAIIKNPHSFLAPVDYSCMGYSVPAAIGAKLGNPNKPVAGLVGDGAFLMTGLEMATARSYGAGVVFFILRDRELSQIAQFQKASLTRTTCTQVHDYDAPTIAKALGIECHSINSPGETEIIVQKAWQTAKAGEPVLVDVRIDYSKPTYFSKGVVKTNFLRFGWSDRARLVSRVIKRKVFGG